MRVVEAFVHSGGNAILRTADGNVISSGVGSGSSGYGASNSAFMGSFITVGSRGQVWVSSASSSSVTVKSRSAVRAVVGSGGKVFIGGSSGRSYYTPLGGGHVSGSSVSVRIITTTYRSSSGGKVLISSSGGGSALGSSVSGGASSSNSGGASGGSSGAGGASGSASGGSSGAGGTSDGSVVVVGGSGGASGGAAGSGVIVTGASVLGSSGSVGTDGVIRSYGSGLAGWTLQGASANDAKEIEVIGDFGGE